MWCEGALVWSEHEKLLCGVKVWGCLCGVGVGALVWGEGVRCLCEMMEWGACVG